ncbi:MAG: ABC-type cobalamin/Fe3+-siderophore transport system, ATPase component [Chitinophagaceae bacterium]|nr:ABC-type cobalamin/Fe3+-siderophore transport system, ATPase component [Chitinophagaceae bacterium]
MLTAQHITYKVGNKTLLDDVSVHFKPGEFNLIIGPNGAGKSTLVNILSHQLQPQQGQVLYNNEDLTNFSIASLAKIRAVLSQNIELAFPLSVTEVVMMGRYPHFTSKPSAHDAEIVQEAMHFFDVVALAERNFMTLSGGEKQRVHFARVAAQIWESTDAACRYLILDEPLTFLDVHYQFDFMHKMKDLLKTQNLVVIGVVHDLNLAAKFADQIILLHQGKLLAQGDRKKVLTKENIKTAYRLEPFIHEDKGAMYLFFE